MSVESSRRQRWSYGCWRIQTVERTKFFQRERIPLALAAKEREQDKMEKMVRNHRDEWTHRKLKVSVGIEGKQVTNTRIAGWTLADGHSNRVKDIQILLEKGVMRRGNQSKVVGRKQNPKMLEHLCGINSRVQWRAQWHRLHHWRRHAQRLARWTQLSALRWICASLHWHSRKLWTLDGWPSILKLELEEPYGQWTRTSRLRKFQVMAVAITKLQRVKWLHDEDGFVFVVKVLGDAYCKWLEKRRQLANHCPVLETSQLNDTHSGWTETSVTSFRRTGQFWQQWSHWFDDRVQSLRPSGWRRWQRWANSWMSVPMKWRSMSEDIVHRGAFGRWIRITERSERAFWWGGNCAESATSAYEADTGRAGWTLRYKPCSLTFMVRTLCQRSRTCISVVREGELREVGVDYAYLGPEGSQVTILVWKCKRTGCLASIQVPEKGMNVYVLAFFPGWPDLGWGSGKPGSGVAIDWVTSWSSSSAKEKRRPDVQTGLRKSKVYGKTMPRRA